METVKLFYLTHCPYCRNAKKAIEALYAEKPAYRSIPIEWIEESVSPEIADRYDYYRVPTLFWGDQKLYEASPAEGYEQIKAQIDAALAAVLLKG